MNDPLQRLPRWLRRPARRGAGMAPRDLSRARAALAAGAMLGPFCFLVFALEPEWNASAVFFLVIALIMVVGTLPVAIAILYGHRHRDRIDAAGESPLDLSMAVLAGSLAAIGGPLLQWVLSG